MELLNQGNDLRHLMYSGPGNSMIECGENPHLMSVVDKIRIKDKFNSNINLSDIF